MIERLQESRGPALGYKVTGRLTGDDIHDLVPQIEEAIAAHKHPIGLLLDVSDMHGATWAARWDEMQFLRSHSDHIARIAIICHDQWQEISELALIATSFMQAQTIYCYPSEKTHAWHWVRMKDMDTAQPLRVVHSGTGLFQDYTPEYTGL